MKYEEMCEICEQEDRDFWNSLDVTERCGITGHASYEIDYEEDEEEEEYFI